MKVLIFVSILLFAVFTCNATKDNPPLNPKTDDTISSVESSRKTVRATIGTADPESINIPFHLNSLSSNQDVKSKQTQASPNINNNNNLVAHLNHISHPINGQSAPPPNSHHQLQQYVRAFSALPKDSNLQQQLTSHQSAPILAQRSPVVNVPPGATGGTGGYILSVNTETGQTITSSGPTPVIMQYLPQSQSTSGIQYLQLMPTRPLIVPISPFLPQLQHPSAHPQQRQPLQPNQPQQQLYQLNQAHQPSATHYLSATRPSAGPAYPYANYAAAQSYVTAGQKLQFNQPFSPSTAQYPIYHSQQSGGGFAAASSSTPVVSMFRPHTGIQLINGPLDMSLNTNEYLPAQSENGYKMRRA